MLQAGLVNTDTTIFWEYFFIENCFFIIISNDLNNRQCLIGLVYVLMSQALHILSGFKKMLIFSLNFQTFRINVWPSLAVERLPRIGKPYWITTLTCTQLMLPFNTDADCLVLGEQ